MPPMLPHETGRRGMADEKNQTKSGEHTATAGCCDGLNDGLKREGVDETQMWGLGRLGILYCYEASCVEHFVVCDLQRSLTFSYQGRIMDDECDRRDAPPAQNFLFLPVCLPSEQN